jgi:hypothetical protein
MFRSSVLQQGLETMKETDMESKTTEQIEVEDDQRCADCGSTEAGNCYFCKAD